MINAWVFAACSLAWVFTYMVMTKHDGSGTDEQPWVHSGHQTEPV
jgi:hypothetical protein